MEKDKSRQPAIKIGDFEVAPGKRSNINLPVADLYTHTPLDMPVYVINGKHAGPRLFITAAIHGDELNGVEIIRRLLRTKLLNRLKGTLVAVPMVNVFGVLNHSRYLPDRRDLNRSFPGAGKGSMASRLASLLMREVVSKCTHGIDIHTGAIHRSNLPHIRANLDEAETARLARAFGVPVLVNANLRDGSLRLASSELEIPTLLYEAGEALRFDEMSIRAGVTGVLNVMRELGMLPKHAMTKHRSHTPVEARSTFWVRSPQGGILRTHVRLGEKVTSETRLATISDPFGDNEQIVTSPYLGIVLGRTSLPLVNEGDGLFHIARVPKPTAVAEAVEQLEEETLPEESDSIIDEPEIK
ncbi:MAG: succinylglutamate desuccinylase/aspartoacylase family protein [Sedimenticola sp.]